MHFLQEITIIATVSVIVTIILGRFKLPVVAGLVLSGALVGPNALSLAKDLEAIEIIAEVGVVFLLFTIGLEFSLSRLKHIFRQVALGGLLQVSATATITIMIALALERPLPEAVVYGFVFALSSTALVLRTLNERNELDAPHGRFIVGTLIFQDLCIVPMVLIIPLLSQGLENLSVWKEVGLAMVQAIMMVVGLFVCSRKLVPLLFKWVDASRSSEVFILTVLCLCIGTAYLTSLTGLSLALGAFLAGMIVADTDFRHRAMGDILPLKDVFVSFFFVSLGMFFNFDVLFEQTGAVLLLLFAFLFGKGLIASLAAMFMRFPPRAAWLSGVGLAQFGEFGFVLLQLATKENVVSSEAIGPLLNAGILSMFLTPLLVYKAPHFTAGERALDPLAKLLRAKSAEELEQKTVGHNDHVIIIGYGISGQLLSSSLRTLSIETVVLEMNSDNVTLGREKGDPVFYADATSEEALGHAHLESCRAVVIMINDHGATKRVLATIDRLKVDVPIFVRTQYMTGVEDFEKFNPSAVVACEVEGGLEVLSRVLRKLEVPRNLIMREIDHARSQTMHSDREFKEEALPIRDHQELKDLTVENILLIQGSRAEGKSPKQLNLAEKTGVLVIAIRREEKLLLHRLADTILEIGDVVYCIGQKADLEIAPGWFDPILDQKKQ
jgi:CPA2 family monovalent cation:H+ antiporter-2|tara:strand:- start:1222 stop:3222 length:2001 start_codon:yes stop_codon:yes gene_type:complete